MNVFTIVSPHIRIFIFGVPTPLVLVISRVKAFDICLLTFDGSHPFPSLFGLNVNVLVTFIGNENLPSASLTKT